MSKQAPRPSASKHVQLTSNLRLTNAKYHCTTIKECPLEWHSDLLVISKVTNKNVNKKLDGSSAKTGNLGKNKTVLRDVDYRRFTTVFTSLTLE